MVNRNCGRDTFALHLHSPDRLLLIIFAFLLLVAPQLSAQVTANPALEIFNAPGATQTFTITVRPAPLWEAIRF